ncbi:hypothetical protein D3C73_1449110 [compost metagenome]
MLRETFKRSSVMRDGGGNVGNHRQLFVRLLLPVNAAGGRQRRASAVSGYQYTTGNHLAILQRDINVLLGARHAGHPVRAM